MTQEREFEFQVEGLAADVIQLLVTEDGISIEQAMDTLYQSRTFRALERPETGLYYTSPVYIYDLIKSEEQQTS